MEKPKPPGQWDKDHSTFLQKILWHKTYTQKPDAKGDARVYTHRDFQIRDTMCSGRTTREKEYKEVSRDYFSLAQTLYTTMITVLICTICGNFYIQVRYLIYEFSTWGWITQLAQMLLMRVSAGRLHVEDEMVRDRYLKEWCVDNKKKHPTL